MGAIDNLSKDNIRLPSPPGIAIRILETVKKDDAAFDELGEIIASDMALTARILKVANSSFYGVPYKVDSITKAVSILGLNALKNIALSFVIAESMRGQGQGKFDFQLFWKRAVTAAVAGELIASRISKKSDDTFITSLLQDIGVVIMYFCRSEDYMKVLDEKGATRSPVEVLERDYFGFDHQEIGAEILKDWGLPENIYRPIRYHHNNNGSPDECKVQSAILFLSDKISSVYHGTRCAERLQNVKKALGECYGISETDSEDLIDAVANKSIEIFSSFEIDKGNMKPLSQLLQEANEELSKLNLSYEQVAMELKQAKERAEKLAHELKGANEQLRELALRDGLTGLYNHRHFHVLLKDELERATRYKRPFALIILDLDHFKQVNDTHGHLVGDIVLKEVSSLVQQKVRHSDIVARYGGEEFVIVLPETDIKGAAILAERLRRDVEKAVISAMKARIEITISLGITAYTPGAVLKSNADVIAAADKALYHSKNTGRNKLSIANIGDAK
jgi:diguanylate cyclase (GGDEF)-like protein